MTLKELLTEKKPDIMKKWFDIILETYPSDTSNFLKRQKNQFANPVGHTIFQGMEHIFDELIKGIDFEKVPLFLDNIIRIRAVQDFTPSQAVSFIFSLKKVIREELQRDGRQALPYEELSELEAEIDTLALLSFDIFIKCREKIYEIRANEAKNMTYRLLQRAKMLCEAEDNKENPAGLDIENVKQKEVTT